MTQPNDCSTLTFTDTSNFGSNDEGYTYDTFTTKTITLYNANEVLIVALDIVDSTPVTFTISNDLYLNIVYQLANDSITLDPITQNFTLSCFVELKYGNSIAYNSLKISDRANLDSADEPYFNVVKMLKAATIFGSRGNSVKAQDCLDQANDYLDDLINN